MALREDCDQIIELASRIIQLARFLNRQTAIFEDNPDLDFEIPTTEKTRLQAKQTNFQNQIKQIVRGW